MGGGLGIGGILEVSKASGNKGGIWMGGGLGIGGILEVSKASGNLASHSLH